MQPRAQWILTAGGFVLVGALAYSAGRGTSGEPAAPTAEAAAADPGSVQEEWRRHDDPMGFTVQVPTSWTVSGDQKSGRVAVRGPDRAEIAVWPVFLPGVRLQSRTAAVVLRSRALRLSPKTEWSEPTAMGAAAVRLQGRDPDRTVLVTLAWTNSTEGAAGFVYLTAAPATRYRPLEQTFARILGGFRIVAAASTPRQQGLPSLQYVRWLDPRENAFTVDVPAGWSVEGGMARNSALEFAPVFELTSPDGRIWISVGDRNLTGFTTLIPGWEAYYPEGSWYPLTVGRLKVRRYLPGEAFAADHVHGVVARRCASLQQERSEDRRDLVRVLDDLYARIYPQVGMARQLAAGEVTFTCQREGQAMRGYHLASTQLLTRDGRSGVWNVPGLYGYVAADVEEPVAQAALVQLIKSFAYTPTWLRMQQGVNDAAVGIITETSERVSDLIRQSYESRQHTLDNTGAARSRATLEVEDLRDPVTSDPIRVESGANYYWIDPRGNIVGTQTDTHPDIDFRQLVR